jgi:uncharacterized protein YozE (UPF0346 family)
LRRPARSSRSILCREIRLCDELQKIAPTYRDNQMKVGDKIYGFPDDGDVFVMYYRKDIFGDPKLQAEFKAKAGRDLTVPKTWKEFDEVGQFLTDKLAPTTYGAAFFRQPPYTMFMFEERFRNEGGKFFDADSDEGDHQQRRRREGPHRHAQREQVHAAGSRAVRLRREPGRVPPGHLGDDDLLAALRPLGRRATAPTRKC